MSHLNFFCHKGQSENETALCLFVRHEARRGEENIIITNRNNYYLGEALYYIRSAVNKKYRDTPKVEKDGVTKWEEYLKSNNLPAKSTANKYIQYYEFVKEHPRFLRCKISWRTITEKSTILKIHMDNNIGTKMIWMVYDD